MTGMVLMSNGTVFALNDDDSHNRHSSSNGDRGGNDEDDDNDNVSVPLLNGRPTASMELSEIERELALADGPRTAEDGEGGVKGTLLESIANVSSPVRTCTMSTCCVCI